MHKKPHPVQEIAGLKVAGGWKYSEGDGQIVLFSSYYFLITALTTSMAALRQIRDGPLP